MKKILLIAATALLTVSAFAQQKFAHVNFAELIQLCPEADEARATINAASNEAQETYQSMVDEFNTKMQQYQSKASTWSTSIRESKEKELTEIQQRIQEFEQSVQMELQQKQQSLMTPIQEKAQEVVNKIAKAAGYIYVFDLGTALYIDETQSVNITPEARKAMNIPDDKTLESLYAELQAQQAAPQQ